MIRSLALACGLVAALATSACASRAPAPPPSADLRYERGDWVVLRDFDVKQAPAMNAPVVTRLLSGARITADVDTRNGLDWRWIAVAGGPAGYVFGLPLQRAE